VVLKYYGTFNANTLHFKFSCYRYEEDQFCFNTLKLGASGYLSKSKAPEELLSAIKKVASGGRYMSSEFVEKMNASLGGYRPQPR